ncbi:MAG: hypothetical protein V4616_14275 [Bacteroidota bacterium]
MNKLKNLFLLGLVAFSSATFVSCEKENNDDNSVKKPSVALVTPANSSITVTPGSTVTVEVLAASGDAKLVSFAVQVSQNGGPFTDYSNAFTPSNNDTTFNENNYTYKRTLPTLSGTGSIQYKFVATDKDGLEGSTTLSIKVESTAISTYTAKILGAVNSSTGSFLSTGNGVVYTIANAKTNSSLIDFVYYYTTTNMASMAAPDDATAASIYNNASNGIQTWATKNSTKYAKAPLTSASTFDGINDGAGIGLAHLTASPNASSVTALAVGNVVTFTTAGGKDGVFKVSKITTGANGSITIDVKVEK